MSCPNNKKVIFLALGVSCLGFVSGSGCGSSASTGSSGATTIATLPTATGEVSGALSSALLNPDKNSTYAATTGLKVFGTATNTAFTASSSRGMCESTIVMRDILREVSKPDKILCYMGVMEAKGNLSAFNPYDGADHIISLKNSGTEMIRFKMNIAKATDGTISSFKGFTCTAGSGTMAQDEYVGTTISSTSASMTAVSSWASSGNSSKARATVSGSYTGGSWASKKLEVQTTGTFTSGTTNTFSNGATVNQGATSLNLSAFRKGTYGASTYETTLYAVIQGLNMTKLPTFALGDGSVKYSATYSGGTGDTGTQSWNGDTKAIVTPASSGTYYAAANAATLPTSTTPSITFAAAETWDCSGTATSIDMTSMFVGSVSGEPTEADMVACDAKFGGANDNAWIDCSATDGT